MRLPILLIGFLTASFLCGCVNSLENALDAQAITTNSILPPRQSSDADESINPLAEETTSDSGNSLFDLQEEDVASSGEEVNPKLAFPVGFPESLRGKQRKVLFPDDKWVLQYESPFIPTSVDGLFIHNTNELWITGTSGDIMKYMIDSGKWVVYNTVDDIEIEPNQLLLTSRGEIWGFNNIGFEVPYSDLPVLSRYNPITDKFESVMDSERLLIRGRLMPWGKLIEDEKTGVFWMILEDEAREQYVLYSFDPETNIAKPHIDLGETPFYPSSLVAAPDGNIWMVDREDKGLLYYDPVEEELHTFQEIIRSTYREMPRVTMNISPEPGTQLYVDRYNRLWVGDIGWLDFSDPSNLVWYKVIRSPVFLAENYLPTSYYTWVRPDFIYQATNGIYWFSSVAGIVRLDPATAEWSLITTFSSAVAEDDDQNIWIVIDKKIFKFDEPH